MVEIIGGWLTPTSLFLLLNIVILTILLISIFANHKHPHQTHPQEVGPTSPPPQLFRTPSLLSRVTSFNFATTTPPPLTHQAPLSRSPSLLSRVASFNFSQAQAQAHNDPGVHDDEAHQGSTQEEVTGPSTSTSTSTTEPRKKAAKRNRKYKAAAEEVQTVPFRKAEEEVDAKADDFINKFKQQLKMQRLESLLRCRTSAIPA